MYIYILLAMVFFAVAVAPQVLALWYCNWVSKMEAMMEAMAFKMALMNQPMPKKRK